MTAKELLDSKGTSTINVVKLMEEYAEIQREKINNILIEFRNKLLDNIDFQLADKGDVNNLDNIIYKINQNNI